MPIDSQQALDNLGYCWIFSGQAVILTVPYKTTQRLNLRYKASIFGAFGINALTNIKW